MIIQILFYIITFCAGNCNESIINEYDEKGRIHSQAILIEGRLIPLRQYTFREDSKNLIAIEYYDENHVPCGTEHFFWNGDTLIGCASTDEDGKPAFCRSFLYNQNKKVAKESCYANLLNDKAELAFKSDGSPYIKDVAPHITTYFYSEEPPYSLLRQEESLEQESSGFFSFLNSLLEYIRSYSYYNYIEKDLEKSAHEHIGKVFFDLTGPKIEQAEVGIYGYGEVSDKVRVTAINGILNLREHCVCTIEMLSSTHGGVNIHYIFHPSEGWTTDLVKGCIAKMGYVSQHTILLAETWKRLIAEMGGAGNGGIIIHYAHSIGGTNTDVAKTLLTEQERKMIRVITVGSATMLPNEGFADVINYVSYRDGVSLFADPLGILRGMHDNVVFVGSIFGIPLVDHMLTMDTYKKLTAMLGKQFTDTYGKISNSR